MNQSSSHPSIDWFWEGNVQAALIRHLMHDGWQIDAVADTITRARGVDIQASLNGQELLVEVKGFPSRLYLRGSRQGEIKPTQPALQARHWLSDAVFKAMELRSKRPEARIAIGLPKVARYESLLQNTRASLKHLAINVYLVSEDGAVDSFLSGIDTVRHPALVPDMAGVLRVGNTRVSFETVLEAIQRGLDADGIKSKYPDLELTDIFALQEYYIENRFVLDRHLTGCMELAARNCNLSESRSSTRSLRDQIRSRAFDNAKR
jgi:uncharacterized protein (DUF433 family)